MSCSHSIHSRAVYSTSTSSRSVSMRSAARKRAPSATASRSLDHYHRLGTLTSDDVERITADLERAAREAPATGPGELSAYVSQRLGFEDEGPSAGRPARAGHTVSMPTELRESADRHALVRPDTLTGPVDCDALARSHRCALRARVRPLRSRARNRRFRRWNRFAVNRRFPDPSLGDATAHRTACAGRTTTDRSRHGAAQPLRTRA